MKKYLPFLFSVCACTLSGYSWAQPANNDACSAQSVTLGMPVSGNCSMATVEPNEISPPNNMGGDCTTSWCDGTLDGTVWYTFVAPPSGIVTISSCRANNNADTQFAVYEATDCGDFNTFSLLVANDDKPDGCNLGNSGYASEIITCSLNPGSTYYLQIDGFQGDVSDFEFVITQAPSCPLIAFVQFYHSSPDLAIATVDIRMDGVLVADNLNYNEATPFIQVTNIFNAYISINPSNSIDDSNPYYAQNVNLGMQKYYTVPIVGIYSSSGYNTTFVGPMSLMLTGIDVPMAPVDPGNQHIAFFNNVTDATGFRYFYNGIDAYGPVYYASPLSDEYLLTNHPFDLYAISNPTHYGTFDIPFEDYIGQTISVVTSGFVDPSQNSNGPGLNMCVVHTDGTVDCFQNLGIDEQTLAGNFSVYPNPATSTVNVVFNQQGSDPATIEIIDLLGQVVYTDVLNDLQTGENTRSIAVSSLKPGTYQLRLLQGTAVSLPQPVVITH